LDLFEPKSALEATGLVVGIANYWAGGRYLQVNGLVVGIASYCVGSIGIVSYLAGG
jgi:hypothetical protein